MLPAPDVWTNYGTWSVPECALSWVGYEMTRLARPEKFDPEFKGQDLETTYFDTTAFTLRKRRLKKEEYLTLRIRCYPGDLYALSAKTEDAKYRGEIDSDVAEDLIANGITASVDAARLLPAKLAARLLSILKDAGESRIVAVSTICCHRYAVENSRDRLTLDVSVVSEDRRLINVLEYKCTRPDPAMPPFTIPLHPIKLSKFLWSTSPQAR